MGVTCEPRSYITAEALTLFDDLYSVPHAEDTGGRERESNIPGSTRALVHTYVSRRRAAGQINERTATQLWSRLADFARTAPDNPRRITRRHVEAWMERPDLAPQYRRARLSALRGFTKWCVGEGHMTKDPCLMVPNPKIPPRLPKRLTQDEANGVASTAAGDTRTLLVVSLMLQEGLRRIEVSRLDVEDIDPAERTMTIRGKGGQGTETAVLPITEETWRILVRYLAESGHTHGPLIRNRVRKHGRMSPGSISDLVRAAMIEAGVKRPGDHLRTPHSLRHTAAHGVLKQTGDIRTVQKVLRHRSVRSSEIYLNGYVDDLRPAMEGRKFGHYAS